MSITNPQFHAYYPGNEIALSWGIHPGPDAGQDAGQTPALINRHQVPPTAQDTRSIGITQRVLHDGSQPRNQLSQPHHDVQSFPVSNRDHEGAFQLEEYQKHHQMVNGGGLGDHGYRDLTGHYYHPVAPVAASVGGIVGQQQAADAQSSSDLEARQRQQHHQDLDHRQFDLYRETPVTAVGYLQASAITSNAKAYDANLASIPPAYSAYPQQPQHHAHDSPFSDFGGTLIASSSATLVESGDSTDARAPIRRHPHHLQPTPHSARRPSSRSTIDPGIIFRATSFDSRPRLIPFRAATINSTANTRSIFPCATARFLVYRPTKLRCGTHRATFLSSVPKPTTRAAAEYPRQRPRDRQGRNRAVRRQMPCRPLTIEMTILGGSERSYPLPTRQEIATMMTKRRGRGEGRG
jgi:hypothetical protein